MNDKMSIVVYMDYSYKVVETINVAKYQSDPLYLFTINLNDIKNT